MLAFLYSLKILYFVSLLIITNIKLYFTFNTSSFNLSSLTIKFITTNSYSLDNTYNNYSFLYNKCHIVLFSYLFISNIILMFYIIFLTA